MADKVSIASPKELEAWLGGKPSEWAPVIALRSALRVFPLVFAILDVPDSEFEPDQKQGVILRSWRANFISSVALAGPTDEVRRTAVRSAAAAAFAATAAAAADADATAAADPAAAAAVISAAYAAAAADPDAAAAVISAAYAAAAADPDSLWDSVAMDCGFLAARALIDESAALLLKQPLWPMDVRDKDRSRDNVPPWVRRPFDRFAEADWVKDGAWALIAAWYRALLPIGPDREARNIFDSARGRRLAEENDEFWTVTDDRSPDQIMEDVAEILGWKLGRDGEDGNEALSDILDADVLPNGLPAEYRDGKVVLGNSGDPSDVDAAAKPATLQLHNNLLERLGPLCDQAERLGNQFGWEDFGSSCSRLRVIVEQGPEVVAERIGDVWADIVELGTFLDQDDNAKRQELSSYVEPLDPAVRRRLESALMIGVPYARSFPTAVRFDTDVAMFRNGPELIAKAMIIVENGRDTGWIKDTDATFLLSLLGAATRPSVQGEKAQSVGVQTSRNVVLVSAQTMIAAYLGASLGAAAPDMQLIRPGIEFFLKSDKAIVELMEDLPSASRHAYRLLIDRLGEDPPGMLPRRPVVGRRESKPEDEASK